MSRDLLDRFGPRIKRNVRIEEKVGRMTLCLSCFNDFSYISLEHNGETYVFSFDYKTPLNILSTQIRKKVKKRNQEPTEGYENFTWQKANVMIQHLREYQRKNYI